MKAGMTKDVPNPYAQSPGTEQHQAVKTKTLGSAGGFESPTYREVSERVARQYEQAKTDEQAKKANSEILERVSEMRHLKYEVIEDADIVQISVIRSKDGTLVRKVPPDKIVGFARKFKERKHKLDLKA